MDDRMLQRQHLRGPISAIKHETILSDILLFRGRRTPIGLSDNFFPFARHDPLVPQHSSAQPPIESRILDRCSMANTVLSLVRRGVADNKNTQPARSPFATPHSNHATRAGWRPASNAITALRCTESIQVYGVICLTSV